MHRVSISILIAILPIWDLPLMPSLQIAAQKQKDLEPFLWKSAYQPN